MNILKINGQTLTGIYVDAAVSFNKPAKRVQTFEVPGRNGNLIIDEGTFDNVLISYPVYEKDTFPAEFDDLVNWLASLEGYQRIECSNDPDHYRMGRFVVPQTPTAKRLNRDGYYQLSFDCKPQRWLLSGEEDTEIDNDAVVLASDNEPYLFRKSGGAQDIGDSDREDDKLIGGTVAWNQQINNGNFADGTTGFSAHNGTLSASDNTLSFTLTAVGNANGEGRFQQSRSIPTGHVIYFHMEMKPAHTNTHQVQLMLVGSGNKYKALGKPTGGVWNEYSRVFMQDATSMTAARLTLAHYAADGYAIGDIDQFRNLYILDLTQMFGETIANYIVSLSVEEAPAYVRKLFPKNYYAYDAGSLQSVNASKHVTRGFNQWDEETANGYWNHSNNGAFVAHSSYLACKNKIPVLPNTTYFWQTPTVAREILYYDSNDNLISYSSLTSVATTFTTPSGCASVAFYMGTAYGTTYNDDICINISKTTGEPKNGDYVPYDGHVYTLDDTLELRGILKLDANNQLYYNGDSYASDGTVERKYGIVDLGTLTWNYDSSYNFFYSSSLNSLINKNDYRNTVAHPIFCAKYSLPSFGTSEADSSWANVASGTIGFHVHASNLSNPSYVYVKDTNYTTAAAFKTAMSGVYLVYVLATPTSESATGFTNPQNVDPLGTEEYTDNGVEQSTRDVAIPVGHETDYFNSIGYVINNPSCFPSKPIIRVYGSGIFDVNNPTNAVTVTIAAHSEPYIDIDSELKECYCGDTNMNGYVSFNNREFPILTPGRNGIMPTPGITKLEIKPRWWVL